MFDKRIRRAAAHPAFAARASAALMMRRASILLRTRSRPITSRTSAVLALSTSCTAGAAEALGQPGGGLAKRALVFNPGLLDVETLLVGQPHHPHAGVGHLARQRARHACDAIAVANFESGDFVRAFLNRPSSTAGFPRRGPCRAGVGAGTVSTAGAAGAVPRHGAAAGSASRVSARLRARRGAVRTCRCRSAALRWPPSRRAARRRSAPRHRSRQPRGAAPARNRP